MTRFISILSLILLIFLSCGKKQAEVRPMEGLAPSELLMKANEFYTGGEIEKALEAYDIIYGRYPTSREYIDAVLGMAKCYNDLGNFEKGMDLLYSLTRENMVPTRVPEIFNQMAKYYEVNAGISTVVGLSNEEQDYRKAIDYYQKAISYPNSDDMKAKSFAQFKIGELNLNMGQYKDAALAYQATVYNYPGTEWADKATKRIEELRQEGKNTLNNIKKEMAKPAQAENQPETPEETPKEKEAPPVQKDTTQVTPPDTTADQEMELK
jgi:tetratricopeptide (TPR) repeat protein